MTRISPSSAGVGACSRKGRAFAPTASIIRNTARGLGIHSQNCLKVWRAEANACWAHVSVRLTAGCRDLEIPAGIVPRLRPQEGRAHGEWIDRKSTRLNSSHLGISYAVFCLKKKK